VQQVCHQVAQDINNRILTSACDLEKQKKQFGRIRFQQSEEGHSHTWRSGSRYRTRCLEFQLPPPDKPEMHTVRSWLASWDEA